MLLSVQGRKTLECIQKVGASNGKEWNRFNKMNQQNSSGNRSIVQRESFMTVQLLLVSSELLLYRFFSNFWRGRIDALTTLAEEQPTLFLQNKKSACVCLWELVTQSAITEKIFSRSFSCLDLKLWSIIEYSALHTILMWQCACRQRFLLKLCFLDINKDI